MYPGKLWKVLEQEIAGIIKVLLLLTGWKLERNRNDWVLLKGKGRNKKKKRKQKDKDILFFKFNSRETLQTKKKYFKENSEF